MIKRKTSITISLAICIVCSLMLLALIFTMPNFFEWFYTALRGSSEFAEAVVKTVVTAFYICAPFAAAALYMLIRLLLNIDKEKIFITANVKYFRYISWCCYAVMIITAIFTVRYIPLLVIAVAMGIIGTLLRVVKNIMQSAVELREENDLTI